MAESLKGSASSLFNVRVMECRLACAMLQAMLGIESSEGVLTTLHDVQRAAGMSLDQLGDAVRRHLPADGVTLDQAAATIGTDPRQVQISRNFVGGPPTLLAPRPCTPTTLALSPT
jgi:hypothetical protein